MAFGALILEVGHFENILALASEALHAIGPTEAFQEFATTVIRGELRVEVN